MLCANCKKVLLNIGGKKLVRVQLFFGAVCYLNMMMMIIMYVVDTTYDYYVQILI